MSHNFTAAELDQLLGINRGGPGHITPMAATHSANGLDRLVRYTSQDARATNIAAYDETMNTFNAGGRRSVLSTMRRTLEDNKELQNLVSEWETEGVTQNRDIARLLNNNSRNLNRDANRLYQAAEDVTKAHTKAKDLLEAGRRKLFADLLNRRTQEIARIQGNRTLSQPAKDARINVLTENFESIRNHYDSLVDERIGFHENAISSAKELAEEVEKTTKIARPSKALTTVAQAAEQAHPAGPHAQLPENKVPEMKSGVTLVQGAKVGVGLIGVPKGIQMVREGMENESTGQVAVGVGITGLTGYLGLDGIMKMVRGIPNAAAHVRI